MSSRGWRVAVTALALGAALLAVAASAQEVTFTDPEGDDDGPGKYVYPTDPVYTPGSFDLTGFQLKVKGDRIEVEVKVAGKLRDVWRTGTGFSLQTVFVFIQTEDRRPPPKPAAPGAKGTAGGTPGKEGADSPAGTPSTAGTTSTAAENSAKGAADAALGASGSSDTGGSSGAGGNGGAGAAGPAGEAPASGTTAARTAAAAGSATPQAKEAAGAKGAAKPAAKVSPGITGGFPGLNVQFGAEDAWDRCLVLSPAPAPQLKGEIETLVPAAMRPAVVLPGQIKGSGSTISATFDRKLVGNGDPRTWGFQVVMAAYDPYPPLGDPMILRVNETESQHRFGGGTDGDCDPNVLDILDVTGEKEGAAAATQHEMLQYECKPDNTPKHLATLRMVRVPKPETSKERREKAREKQRLEEEQERLKREGQGTPPPPGTPATPPVPPPASPAP